MLPGPSGCFCSTCWNDLLRLNSFLLTSKSQILLLLFFIIRALQHIHIQPVHSVIPRDDLYAANCHPTSLFSALGGIISSLSSSFYPNFSQHPFLWLSFPCNLFTAATPGHLLELLPHGLTQHHPSTVPLCLFCLSSFPRCPLPIRLYGSSTRRCKHM